MAVRTSAELLLNEHESPDIRQREIKKSSYLRDADITNLKSVPDGVGNIYDDAFVNGSAVKFRADEEICYYIRYAHEFGGSDVAEFIVDTFRPSVTMLLCTDEDLELDISNPSKFFMLDQANSKMRLNLTHSRIGSKLGRLTQQRKSNSTSNHSEPNSSVPWNRSASGKNVCEKALNDNLLWKWSETARAKPWVQIAESRGYTPKQCNYILWGK